MFTSLYIIAYYIVRNHVVGTFTFCGHLYSPAYDAVTGIIVVYPTRDESAANAAAVYSRIFFNMIVYAALAYPHVV